MWPEVRVSRSQLVSFIISMSSTLDSLSRLLLASSAMFSTLNISPLKVKPLVTSYLLENGLPYNEDSYMNRVWIFLEDYNTLRS